MKGMNTAIQFLDVVKRYNHGAPALAGINLDIPVGCTFGLLGANGAGKSTLLRILTGLVHPTRGEIRLLGESWSPRMLKRVGALIEAPSFYPYLTGRDTLRLLARFYPEGALDPDALLDRVGLAAAGQRRVAEYSLGMKQRLGIAAALVGDPEIVIFDEPTNGMDPPGIRFVRTLLRELSDRDGRTVLVSSHLLEEVERTCDRVAVLEAGQVIAERDLRQRDVGQARLRIEASPLAAVVDMLGADAVPDGEAVIVKVPRHEAPALVTRMAMAGIAIFEVRWLEPALEDLYFSGGGSEA